MSEGGANDGGKNSYRNKIKKRKKKFLANVKGFGKQGNFGRGTHLESDEWNYYINILDVMKKGFDSIDEKTTMADNVLEQTIGKEIHTASNQIACTIIEALLPFSNAENFERFQTTFASNFRPICSDKFASHILEKLVSISMLRAVSAENVEDLSESSETPQAKKRKATEIPSERDYNLKTQFSDEHRQICREFVVKASKFLMNNLEDFVWDTYGSHIMRTCFDSLSGVFQIKKSFIGGGGGGGGGSTESKTTAIDKNLTVPDEWLEILQEYAKRLQAWPQFPDFPYNELSSGLVQSLCTALHTRDKSTIKHMGKRLLNEAFLPTVAQSKANDEKIDVEEVKYDIDGEAEVKPDTDVQKSEENDSAEGEASSKQTEDTIDQNMPSVFSSEPAIRCLETFIQISGPKLFTQIYAMLFCGRLVKLSTVRLTNFSVQKLLDRAKEKEEFEAIFDELEGSIEQLLQIGHTGVVSALAQGCLRLCTRQGPFMKAIQSALDCVQPKEKSDKFAMLVLKLKPYKVAMEDKSNFIHIHGAVILQAMLQFNKPIKLVQCILDTSNDVLTDIFCSPKGSHVVDAFMDSKAVGEKSREKLIRHMNDCYLQMAISKHGSWSVEKLFNCASDAQKSRIVKELSEKQNQLNGSPFGRLLNHKFHVDTYRLSPEQWRASFKKETKADRLFKDIL
ncbi:nucleolar protein 9 [Contarinia nasturtii]|uniref:nucleolar protein 9 n=1 Tax=Contarinia nasturtii TaxID=265458 RepID=UPI0012D4755D|nr:nucleolar protein 9 [Contarinia nasturtii]